jgi:hypothetical protein
LLVGRFGGSEIGGFFKKEELSVAALVIRIQDEAILSNMVGASILFDPV